MSFVIGQCWSSQTEPELGLGFVREISGRTVAVYFEASDIVRRYQVQSAPLQRVQFALGDQVTTCEGVTFEVEHVENQNGLLTYHGQTQSIPETLLAAQATFNTPEDRIFTGHTESLTSYQLRQQALFLQQQTLSSPLRGLIGPKVDLLPHQLYVASQVTKRAYPRVLLSDEVGLGKTIEAGLILHQLLLTGKASRVLIVVPEALTHQWFVEMYRRYNLAFGTLSNLEDLPEHGNVFQERQLFIVSLEFLKTHPTLVEDACANPWDMLVVDEAHHLRYQDGKASPEFAMVERISKQSLGLLLLTATPEQLGLEGHFSRLRLLDPDRFYCFETFIKQAETYKHLAEQAESLLQTQDLSEGEKSKQLQTLIDQHGTGRVLFRNTRASISQSGTNFPKRLACPYPLAPENPSAKLDWLMDILRANMSKKFLLTCHLKQQVDMIEAYLQEHGFLSFTCFHDQMTLLTRDRNATYFSDNNGAQLMVSSEIGSEGRNFQFAHDLILFDLPQDPDVLEQRIGRLDRIGQRSDINIHIPYLRDSAEEALYCWYHQGFNAFEQSPKGARQLKAQTWPHLQKHDQAIAETASKDEFNRLTHNMVSQTQNVYAAIQQTLQEGRDQLIELNSFAPTKAQALVTDIAQIDADPQLQQFLFQVFEHMGIDEKQLDPTTFFLEPGHGMQMENFPELPEHGLRITFDRQTALLRQDTTLLTWDHPMITGIFDLIIGQAYGNVSLSSWQQKPQAPYPALEAQFILSPIAPLQHNAHQFFPPTFFRVALDAQGIDVTENWPREKLQQATEAASKTFEQQIKQLPRKQMMQYLELAKEKITSKAQQTQSACTQNMQEHLAYEIQRLQALQKKSGLVRKAEIEYFKERKQSLTEAFQTANLRLDSFQLIENPYS